MRYVTLSLIFLALFPTRLAAQDIDQRTLEVPHLLAKKCLSHGPDYIDNHCAFDLNVTVSRGVDRPNPVYGTPGISVTSKFNVTIRADSEVEIRPPLKSGERISLDACPHPKESVITESREYTRPDERPVFEVIQKACRRLPD